MPQAEFVALYMFISANLSLIAENDYHLMKHKVMTNFYLLDLLFGGQYEMYYKLILTFATKMTVSGNFNY